MYFEANVNWIRSEYGGRSQLPVAGLRPGIRFQRYIREWLNETRDVEIVGLEIDKLTWQSKVIIQFVRDHPSNREYAKIDEFFELLDGFRVIGVGKITGTKKRTGPE